MVTFTLSISEDLKKKIDSRPEINWAEFLKQRLEFKLNEFKRFEQLKNAGRL